MVKLDGIWRGGTSYPGKPRRKTEPTRRTRSREGAEGGRFAGSTNDPGPEKPGNGVEEKTLEIGERPDKKGLQNQRTRRLRRSTCIWK